ncbi:MAG: UDP-N-acetylmuramoyl-L-alanyl-D-glutamate--2,6-diaminopimelate ligase [Acidobacteria bacterium]|nr:MAG: UDP-N-acetylmuramoyl-L-alanyl-D-glutamate--2,6-diaminopimelate ligase [Acidobacteriota bacterium]
MTFRDLLRGIEIDSESGDPASFQAPICGLHYDSRQIAPGFVFVAMKGETTDGNRYIDAALQRGAVAVVTDSAAEKARAGVAWARVSHGRRALAGLSANFYGHPAEKLKMIGISGTNGKTTTSHLLTQIFKKVHRREPVLIGTIEHRYAGKTIPAAHTTPESLELNRMLAEAAAEGETHAVMEVSSHALAQERVYGIPFDVAVFTNLTRDHLDFHHSMEEYFAAKLRLFSGLGTPPPRVAVINSDDEYGRRLIEQTRQLGSKVMTYGIDSGEFRATNLQATQQFTHFLLQTPAGAVEVSSSLLGRTNVYNVLAAAAAAFATGVPLEKLPAALAASQPAAGRFQRIEAGQPFSIVVDYAHTDDALRNLTALARDFVASQPHPGRVITLFGCGGDRDKSKRPLMGEAAGRGSDFVVLTSDNPRSEDPMAIIEDALPGLQRSGTRYAIEPDRRKAIALAIAAAQPGDIVLIAGKGHEKVQITRAGSARFDDVEVAREALAAAGYGALAGGARQ